MIRLWCDWCGSYVEKEPRERESVCDCVCVCTCELCVLCVCARGGHSATARTRARAQLRSRSPPASPQSAPRHARKTRARPTVSRDARVCTSIPVLGRDVRDETPSPIRVGEVWTDSLSLRVHTASDHHDLQTEREQSADGYTQETEVTTDTVRCVSRPGK